jgi:hypothetical protein
LGHPFGPHLILYHPFEKFNGILVHEILYDECIIEMKMQRVGFQAKPKMLHASRKMATQAISEHF